MNKAMLAARRRELVERCAEQRVGLAYEWQALRRPGAALPAMLPPAVARLAAQVMAHRRLVFAAAGAALVLAIVRPKRLQGLGRLAASGWRIARQGLEMARDFRP